MSTAYDEADSNAATTAQPAPAVPTSGLKQLGHYEIKKQVGAGGMGAVFLAVDTQLKRTVALKVLPKEKAENPILVRRFKSEAQKAAQLEHENIIAVYDAGEADGYCYIALEFVDGIDVHDLVERRGVLPYKRSIDIVKQTARALQHAYERGIVHRDIKPSNLMIRRDGTVKLADMGLARSIDETVETGITRAGTTVGTVDYMSPEQARDSKAADCRSDIYSLGCTWYHMLTGGPPFAEGSLTNKLRAHAQTAPPNPRDKNANVPEGLVAILHRMMAKEPQQRYQTPQELLEDLDASHVDREEVSQKILSALAEEEVRGSSKPTAVVNADGIPVMPPKERRELKDVDGRRDWGFSIRPVLFALFAVTAIGSAFVIGKLIEGWSRALDAPLEVTGNPFKNRVPIEGDETATAEEPEPVLGPGVAAPTGPDPVYVSTEPAIPAQLPPAAAQTPTAPTSGTPTANPAAVPVPGTTTTSVRTPANPGTTVKTVSPTPVTPPMPTSPLTTTPKTAVQTLSTINPPKSTQPKVNKTSPATQQVATTTGGTPPRTTVGPTAGADVSKYPAWVKLATGASKLSTLVVRTGGDNIVTFATLNAAFEKLPLVGGTIELAGNGPFLLRPAKLEQRAIKIRAAENFRPLVVLLPPSGPSTQPLLHVAGGSLELERLHIAADATQLPADTDVTFIGVTGGHLFVTDCSFSLKNTRAGSTTALSLDGEYRAPGSSQISPTYLLLDRTLVMGDALRGVRSQSANLEGIVRGSLLATGSAPLIHLGGTALAGAKRSLQIVASTLSGNGRAFELVATGGEPIPTSISLEDSLVAAGFQVDTPTLLWLKDWPAAATRENGDGPFKNLTWKTTGTLFTGWQWLIQREPEDLLKVSDSAQWRRLWRDESGENAFQDLGWPRLNGGVADQPVDLWDPGTVGSTAIAATGGGPPGAPLRELPTPDTSRVTSAMAHAHRPEMPEPFAPAYAMKIDLTKQDLGKKLAEEKWPDGTTVLATGYGSRTSSPIVVTDKRLRIVFEQSEGTQLVLTPRLADQGQAVPDAFITVKRGTLELVNATIRFPLSDRKVLPSWIMRVEDGNFAFRNCRVSAPTVGAVKMSGLIQWDATNAAAAPPAAGSFLHYGAIVDSYFLGSQTLLAAEMQGSALLLRNSLLVSRDQLFDLKPVKSDQPTSGVVDLDRCTLSAGSRFFELDPSAVDAKHIERLRVFARECVFGPPIPDGATDAPTLLTHRGDLYGRDRLDWWEESCGYDLAIKNFLVDSDIRSTARQNFDNIWKTAWGATQVQRSLSGPGGVFLNQELPAKQALKPLDFALHPTAKGFNWGDGGQPIGANLAQLEPPETKAEPKAKPAAAPPAQKTKKAKPASPSF